jgi:acetyltransferase-like isoleucine patch superfamily enzyme
MFKNYRDSYYIGDTVICNDVWIGAEALIMPGDHIADGAVIVSSSVIPI